jgi:hypothetical protein
MVPSDEVLPLRTCLDVLAIENAFVPNNVPVEAGLGIWREQLEKDSLA